GSNAVTSRRVFGAGFDAAVARQDAGGAVTWYGQDQVGSVRQVFDNTGNATGSRTYSAFGQVTVSGGSGLDRYGWSGTTTDALTGLVGDDARQYDPGLGRWTSDDPLGFAAGDANVSRYVGNGPTNATDPSGLDWVKSLLGPSEYRDPVNPNRTRNDAWHAWVNPWIVQKGIARLSGMAMYGLEDVSRANGYDGLATTFRVVGDLTTIPEGIADLANINPFSKTAMAWSMAERFGAIYDTLRGGGSNVAESVLVGGFVFTGEMTGVVGLMETIAGDDMLTREKYTSDERWSKGVVSGVQFAMNFIPGPKGAKGCGVKGGGPRAPKLPVTKKPFMPPLPENLGRLENRSNMVPERGPQGPLGRPPECPTLPAETRMMEVPRGPEPVVVEPPRPGPAITVRPGEPPAAPRAGGLRGITTEGEFARNGAALTAAERAEVEAYARSLGVPEDRLWIFSPRPNGGPGTAYGATADVVGVGPNVLPASPEVVAGLQLTGPNAPLLRAHSELSARATLAHEVVGHRGAELAGRGFNNSTPLGHALDEAQAHFRAALHAPGLSDLERSKLWIAGFERLQSQGLRFKDVKGMLYLEESGQWGNWTLRPPGTQLEPPKLGR
ncbi:MAG: hypothetical protein MUF18_21155, partial [Fimbriiglobus sp.]|nr:hypothetical protein [Fimbriiglobus sp.]